MKSQIIVEKYMEDELNDELMDFKFMCFNSRVKVIFVCSERFSDSKLKVTIYDTDWKRIFFEYHDSASNVETDKTKSYEEMITIAEKLSEQIPFVRIDFYKI